MAHELPLPSPSVVGSHALPSWLLLVGEAAAAVRLAIRDQLEAGVDDEMAEIDLWSEFPTDKEVAVWVVDVKAFPGESPEEIAARARVALTHVPADRLGLVPDCGLRETPRWVAVSRLRSLVEAARLLRRELSGKA